MNQSGSHPLVDRWYEEFNDQLIGFLSQGIRSRADVHDLAQEIYLRLLRAKNPELIESPRAYLYRIAIHVLDEWRSKERRARLHSNKGLDTLVAKSDAFDDPERRDVAVDLRQALATLPVRYGTTLVLRWHHGMSYKEIAAHLDVTERMVKRYIVKGYAKLRTHLDTEGGK